MAAFRAFTRKLAAKCGKPFVFLMESERIDIEKKIK
jgi:hypothetical protein